ncbi:hypothetical protein ACLBWP_03255 [Microbacterium sp. M1A1_1b]
MASTEFKRMQQRGKPEAELLDEDPVLVERELAVASDSGKVWAGDGVTPLSARPYLIPADPGTNQMPDQVRLTIAANLADPTTPEGAALAEAITAGGGGGGSTPLSFDPATGLITVPTGSSITYDSASGLITAN